MHSGAPGCCGDVVLQLGGLGGDLRREQVGAGGGNLAGLDEDGSGLFQRQPEPAGKLAGCAGPGPPAAERPGELCERIPTGAEPQSDDSGRASHQPSAHLRVRNPARAEIIVPGGNEPAWPSSVLTIAHGFRHLARAAKRGRACSSSAAWQAWLWCIRP